MQILTHIIAFHAFTLLLCKKGEKWEEMIFPWWKSLTQPAITGRASYLTFYYVVKVEMMSSTSYITLFAAFFNSLISMTNFIITATIFI